MGFFAFLQIIGAKNFKAEVQRPRLFNSYAKPYFGTIFRASGSQGRHWFFTYGN